MSRPVKNAPTSLNLWVLGQVFAGGADEVANRVAPPHRSHLTRLVRAGLVEIAGAVLRLTPAGRAALGPGGEATPEPTTAGHALAREPLNHRGDEGTRTMPKTKAKTETKTTRKPGTKPAEPKPSKKKGERSAAPDVPPAKAPATQHAEAKASKASRPVSGPSPATTSASGRPAGGHRGDGEAAGRAVGRRRRGRGRAPIGQ